MQSYESCVVVTTDLIDAFGHVNNIEYLKWCEQVAWAHSHALGVCLGDFREHDFALVAYEHHLRYSRPCFEGDEVRLTTILGACSALRLTRHYAFYVGAQQVFEGSTEWVGISLATAKPRRMPAFFMAAYGIGAAPTQAKGPGSPRPVPLA